MRTFHCDHCDHQVFFENTSCVSCGRTLAFLPDHGAIGSLDALGDGTWRSRHSTGGSLTAPVASWGETPAPGALYRLCENYTAMQVCNWAVPADDPSPLCRSCRLTLVIPDVAQPAAHEAWFRLESAKRRLVFTLLALGLPLSSRHEDPPGGLAFEFKGDVDPDAEPVLTGHSSGVITVNIAEADDAERERRRAAVHEPYRTLLGHLRHESGHYYWERLIRDQSDVEAFRAVFGDERLSYTDALDAHYHQGPPSDWQSRFVSAYASAHPWEDWAETWAHYLHMVDTLDTAASCGLSLVPPRAGEPEMERLPPQTRLRDVSFERLIDNWFPLTYAINSLNRGLGLADPYPFVLSQPAVDKLRYVHGIIARGQ